MGSTLTALRTGVLNVELGLDADSDDRFGTTAQREYALQESYRRLWPRMARLDREEVTLVTDATDYTLVTVQELVMLELFDASDAFLTRINDYRSWVEDDTTSRLSLSVPLATTLSLFATGYLPYTVPASGAATSTLPTEREYIVVQGARAFLFRRLYNQFIVYERHENENRKTSLSAGELMGMAREAEGMFQAGMSQYPRKMATARKATGRR